MDRVIDDVCVCVCVHVVKEKWLELSPPNLVQMLCMAATSFDNKMKSEGQGHLVARKVTVNVASEM